MERIKMTRGKDTFLVAPRGVDKLLSEGWIIPGADRAPGESKVPQDRLMDSGPIKVKARKLK
jgi:hypothetical protein